jgi:stress-induced morphogen
MSVTAAQLDSAIRQRLQAEHVEVVDTSGGCGQAFEVVIVSNVFANKNKLVRHRLVNSALKEEIAVIHAFTQVGGNKVDAKNEVESNQKSYTPDEWKSKS